MKRPDKIEWFLRLATFGSALAVGVIEAWNIWASSRDLSALIDVLEDDDYFLLQYKNHKILRISKRDGFFYSQSSSSFGSSGKNRSSSPKLISPSPSESSLFKSSSSLDSVFSSFVVYIGSCGSSSTCCFGFRFLR